MQLIVMTAGKRQAVKCRAGWRNVAAKLQALGWPSPVAVRAGQAYEAKLDAFTGHAGVKEFKVEFME